MQQVGDIENILLITVDIPGSLMSNGSSSSLFAKHSVEHKSGKYENRSRPLYDGDLMLK